MDDFTESDPFPPTDEAWTSRLYALDPQRYAATRNHLRGAVSQLSPYITHGFFSLGEAVTDLLQRTPLTPDDQLFKEFAWRSFYHHVWAQKGEAIFQDLRPALPNVRYADSLPADIREGRTGLPVIDQAVASLYSSGYLHNHARMWLASYIVHLRHVHWKAGADWLYSHLLDGDLASNHLSWQWVASTFSIKPYLFNADNVSKYAPVAWHCQETPLAASYESLERIARGQWASGQSAFLKWAEQAGRGSPGIKEPACYRKPPDLTLNRLNLSLNEHAPSGLDEAHQIELVHAWALRSGSLASGINSGRPYRLGVIHLPSQSRWPWSQRRWEFVLTRMKAVCNALFIGDANDLIGSLPKDKNYYLVHELAAHEIQSALSGLNLTLLSPPPLFKEPDYFCPSFSKYFRSVY